MSVATMSMLQRSNATAQVTIMVYMHLTQIRSYCEAGNHPAAIAESALMDGKVLATKLALACTFSMAEAEAVISKGVAEANDLNERAIRHEQAA